MEISRFVNGALTSSSPPRGRFLALFAPLHSQVSGVSSRRYLGSGPPLPVQPTPSDTLTPIGSSEPTHKTLLGALRSHSSNCLGKFTLPRGQSHVTPAPMIDRGNCPAASRERETQRVRGRHLGGLAEPGPCAMDHEELSGGVRRSPTGNNSRGSQSTMLPASISSMMRVGCKS